MATVQLKSLTSLNNIKKALLTFLPQLWTASFTNPELVRPDPFHCSGAFEGSLLTRSSSCSKRGCRDFCR
jgi:hypothetical protein